MPESAKEIDLDPRRYVGLQLPLSADNVNNFALTKNSTQAAEHNLKNLLLTQIGERLAQPNFGSRLKELCFEQNDNDLPEKIDIEIKRSVKEWLPYINIIATTALTAEGDENKIYVKIKFSTTLSGNAFQVMTLNVT